MRFYFDRKLANGFTYLFLICFVAVVAIALLAGRFFETIEIPLIFLISIAAFWFSFAKGMYIDLNNRYLTVAKFFIKSRPISVEDIISINERAVFGGFVTEVYIKVRSRNGEFTKSLINKPGLSEKDYTKLYNYIHSANPEIKISI